MLEIIKQVEAEINSLEFAVIGRKKKCFGSMISGEKEECRVCGNRNPCLAECESSKSTCYNMLETEMNIQEIKDKKKLAEIKAEGTKAAVEVYGKDKFKEAENINEAVPKNKSKYNIDWLPIIQEILANRHIEYRKNVQILMSILGSSMDKSAVYYNCRSILNKLGKQGVLTWDGKAKSEIFWT